MAFFAGISGDVILTNDVETYTMHVQEWTANDEASEIDTTHKSSNGYGKLITGRRQATGSFTALWDSDIITQPPQLRSGSCVYLALQATNCENSLCNFQVPNAVITSVAYTHSLDGALGYVCNWKSDGPYTVLNECSETGHCDNLCGDAFF
ncbi:MAG: hypothetical protein KGZ39_05680 [Simkania sp.]|nr:hypothetical protein [Simkania sp.]